MASIRSRKKGERGTVRYHARPEKRSARFFARKARYLEMGLGIFSFFLSLLFFYFYSREEE